MRVFTMIGVIELICSKIGQLGGYRSSVRIESRIRHRIGSQRIDAPLSESAIDFVNLTRR